MRALTFLLLLAPATVLAWGKDGHRIVGELAQHQLKPAAQAEVTRLLAGEAEPTLAGVANWADELRETDPERKAPSSKWHYVNFPRADCHYTPPRDCPDSAMKSFLGRNCSCIHCSAVSKYSRRVSEM